MPLIPHPHGDYLFLPGISPYSCGVVSAPGFEIAHVTFRHPIAYRRMFDLIENYLKDSRRPKAALCGIELRSPRPFTFSGFAEFNSVRVSHFSQASLTSMLMGNSAIAQACAPTREWSRRQH
jgi:hypothetical protein